MSTPFGHGGTNVLPQIIKYFSEIFSPIHIKLTINNPNKDFVSVEQPLEVENFKLDRKIFLS